MKCNKQRNKSKFYHPQIAFNGPKPDARIMPFLINGVVVDLKVDSGADVNVISKKNFKAIAKGDDRHLELEKDHNVQLLDFGGNEIKCAGQVTTSIATSRQGKKLSETFYVAENRPQSVLSYPTATDLGVLTMTKTVLRIKAVNAFPTMPIEPVKLQINEEITPKACIYNNIPAALEPFLDDHWATLERRGVIEPVPGAYQWLSRVDIVPKKEGTYRVIIDMRPANRAIARRYYPMPNPDQLITKIRGAKFFAKIDLKSAYHHVPLHRDSRHMTAFMTSKGARQFTRLPFGLNCAPEVFQQIMDQTFGHLEGVVVYLDDILIHATDEKLLKARWATVMEVVARNNLTLNLEKCVEKATTVEFLGSVLSADGCIPTPERLKGIKHFATPATYEDLRKFIGLVNYISKHLWHISDTMEPMRRLLEGDSKVLRGAKLLDEWGEEQEKAFRQTKREVARNIIKRGYYNANHLTKIITDASPVGIAGMVVQFDMDEPEETRHGRVIACISRSLTRTERMYPQTQREALAITWAINKLCYYLAGTHFILVTDHEPMKFIFGDDARKLTKRAVTRADNWAMALSQYSFDVEVVKSGENLVDILSRCPAPYSERDRANTTPQCITTGLVATITVTPEELIRRNTSLTPAELQEATAKDPQMQEVIQALAGSLEWKNVTNFARFRDELSVVDGIILRGDRMVVPEKLQQKAMAIAHRSHPGMSTTKHLLRKYVWWPAMDRAVEEFIKSCTTCIKLSTSDPPEPLLLSNFPQGPWQNLAIDFWSGADTDPKVLVVADYYSKAIRGEVMKGTTSEETIRVLERMFSEWGWPKSVKHDNGPQLVSEPFRRWMRENDIISYATTPRNAQENGLVERHMKGVTRAFAIARIEGRHPEEALKQYITDYNSWPHTVTQLPPRDVLMGRTVKTRFPMVKGTEKHHSYDTIARARDLAFKTKKKMNEDRKRKARTSDVKVGDIVFIRNHDRRLKTDPNFSSEKYEVIARSGGRLTLKSLKDGNKKVRKTVDIKRVPINAHDGTGVQDETNQTKRDTAATLDAQQTSLPTTTNTTQATVPAGQPQPSVTKIAQSVSGSPDATAAPQATVILPNAGRPRRLRIPPKKFGMLELNGKDAQQAENQENTDEKT